MGAFIFVGQSFIIKLLFFSILSREKFFCFLIYLKRKENIMDYSVISQSGQTPYGVEEFVVNTPAGI
jgi:hypothetical protein